jgi:hypothetical protein
MQDLLLEPGALFLSEGENAPETLEHLGVGLSREVGPLGAAEGTVQCLELPLGLLYGTAQAVEGLASLGFGLVHHCDFACSFR